MRAAVSLLLALSSIACAAEAPRYLPSIWQRWDVSDLVCTGLVSKPVHTGIVRRIDGSDRDQLLSEVELETCFKGGRPLLSPVRVLGYSPVAERDISGGYAYSGPPPGFVRKGRNLLFLRQTGDAGEFEIAVPIYETAISLGDSRPYYPVDISATGIRFALTREFEAVLIQSEESDVTYIDRLFDLLGIPDAITELIRFSESTTEGIQRDIAVALLAHGQLKYEPSAISLLIDKSAIPWKRANAAGALGAHGTEGALPIFAKLHRNRPQRNSCSSCRDGRSVPIGVCASD